ncbi:hypothetical protein B1L11_00310 [Microbispora sp. GKU 823]|nr:hypothetical protein B1L11_00310 [Microbispora sp. GKU 823]
MRAAPSTPVGGAAVLRVPESRAAELVVEVSRAAVSLDAESLDAASLAVFAAFLAAVLPAAESPVAGPRTAGLAVPGEAIRVGRGRCASLVLARPVAPLESLPPRRAGETGEGGRDRVEGFAVRAWRPGNRDASAS